MLINGWALVDYFWLVDLYITFDVYCDCLVVCCVMGQMLFCLDNVLVNE